MKAFFAYPGVAPASATVPDAIAEVTKHSITPWSTLNIYGFRLDHLIREKIEECDFLLADITTPNFNVYYEIGYAVGAGKSVVPTVDYTQKDANANVALTGLFATTGQLRYQNFRELASKIDTIDLSQWRPLAPKPKNYNQPLFFLSAVKRTNFIEYIATAIANSKVEKRVFDPTETTSMSLNEAFADASVSTGLILPLLGPEIEGDLKHNLLASVLAGMAHARGLEPLILQYNDQPAPVDYREFIATARGRVETTQEVEEYCQEILVLNQRSKPLPRATAPTLLEQIDLGKSAAEQEALRLDQYFIRTAQFTRASRAKSALIVGRKGSGKTAIFYATLDKKKGDRRNLVVPLLPVSHRLSELRSHLLSVKTAGFFDHTIEAFWQYIIYMEVIYALREAILPKAKYNFSKLRKIEEIEKRFKMGPEHVYGDFTSRLESAVELVIESLRSSQGSSQREVLTNLLFEKEIASLRDAVTDLSEEFNSIVLLFDNIDKGWPATRVERHDIATVQHLINILNKIQRELGRRKVDFEYLLFLRGDVYESLVENTADRGKFDPIKVDWSDVEQLTNLLRQRVIASVPEEKAVPAWNAINPLMSDGRSAIDVMIGASLMRPRFLIDLAETALSIAVNRGHSMISQADVETALEKHSLYLVTDFGFEVRDISGLSQTIFYDFIGEGQRLLPDDVERIIRKSEHVPSPKEVVDLLLWYGFLGIPDARGRPVYIYNRDYDFRRLEAERDRLAEDLVYFVNPAFLEGLRE